MRRYAITTRPALRRDAPIIARVVAMAIGDEVALHNYCGDDYLAVLEAVARTKSTQYSWQNAIVAECDGVVAGAVVGYDGACLGALREGTLSVIRRYVGRLPSIVDETEVGEYYLDSVAVLPQFRGHGVGRALVEAFVTCAYARGAERVGLIVDVENPDAEKLYLSCGFRSVGERSFFSHQMRHLQRGNDWSIRERVERSTLITEFQRRVYLELLDVPEGKTISYGQLAQRVGCRSAQAVAQALRRNPFVYEVPCHRVVAADGSIGGYFGKRSGEYIAIKRRLLDMEREKK